MLKILIVYYEPISSGQTAHVLSLAYGLNKNKYEITVILPDQLQCCFDDFRKAGVKIVPLPIGKIYWKPRAIFSLIKMIRQERYDIVHIHSQEAGMVARPLSCLAGARLIFYTPQTIDIRRVRFRWIYILFEKLLANFTNYIFSVNEIDRHRMVNWGIDSHKVITLPNGIDLSKFVDQSCDIDFRNQMGLPEDGLLVMQVGRLAEQKDPLSFVKGAEIILMSHPHTRFVMVGDGPLSDIVKKVIYQKGLSDKVMLLGHVPDAYRLVSAADVVTLTSRWEGTPYSIMEAMAWRKPVVVTAVNGCKELVIDGQTGFAVESGNIDQWAKCLRSLLDSRYLRQTMGEQGYQRVRDLYSVEKMVEKLERYYQYSPVINKERQKVSIARKP